MENPSNGPAAMAILYDIEYELEGELANRISMNFKIFVIDWTRCKKKIKTPLDLLDSLQVKRFKSVSNSKIRIIQVLKSNPPNLCCQFHCRRQSRGR